VITDEQVKIAECAYNHRSVAHSFSAAMRKALEAYEASKWVKFDIDDKSTHPQNLQHVIVLYHTGVVGSDKWSILKIWMFSGCKECVTHWMPLPEFNKV
jgi:hypothetical protein